MNRIVLCENLQKIADDLDAFGLHQEADNCTKDLKKIASGEMSVREAGWNIGKALGLGNFEKNLRPFYKPLIGAAAIYYGMNNLPWLSKTLGLDLNSFKNVKTLTSFLQKKVNVSEDVAKMMATKIVNNAQGQAVKTLNQSLAPKTTQTGYSTPQAPQVTSMPMYNVAFDVKQITDAVSYNTTIPPATVQNMINTKKQTIMTNLANTPDKGAGMASLFEKNVKQQLNTMGYKI